ncbi:MAG: hypothetical protein QOE82_96 [Thermoanaerobaculia bacterium]|jgi:uncharacterized protein YciI|nr:hypothetical protein [Thermoanaerobaculia bacterium]
MWSGFAAAIIWVMALTSTAAPSVEGPTTPQQYARANKAPLKGFIVLLRLRYDLFGKWKDTGKWPDDPAANEALNGHVKYWNDQRAAGRAVFAGGMNGDYWDNVALIILDVPTEAEAKALVAADPAVKAYVFQAQVRPFDTSWVSTKYFEGSGAEAGKH